MTKLADDVQMILNEHPHTPPGDLGKIAKRARGKKAKAPASQDTRSELRKAVDQHKVMTRLAVSVVHPTKDRKFKDPNAPGGVRIVKSQVPDEIKVQANMLAKSYREKATGLKSVMTRELNEVPVYTHFLSEVYGCGPVVSAYLVSHVRFGPTENPEERWCEKPSQLTRFCGMAVIGGRLERPTRGVKLGYVAVLRTNLFQLFSAMMKNASKFTVCDEHRKVRPEKGATQEEKAEYRATTLACPDCAATAFPFGVTTKYLDIWMGVKHRELSSERYRAETNEYRDQEGNWHKGGRKRAHSKGWHKAASVFLEDLYIIGRAAAGLPVWPSYYAAKLGYEHGGKVLTPKPGVNVPKHLTLEEALELVGDVGPRPASAPIEEIELDATEEGIDEIEAEAIAAEE